MKTVSLAAILVIIVVLTNSTESLIAAEQESCFSQMLISCFSCCCCKCCWCKCCNCCACAQKCKAEYAAKHMDDTKVSFIASKSGGTRPGAATFLQAAAVRQKTKRDLIKAKSSSQGTLTLSSPRSDQLDPRRATLPSVTKNSVSPSLLSGPLAQQKAPSFVEMHTIAPLAAIAVTSKRAITIKTPDMTLPGAVS